MELLKFDRKKSAPRDLPLPHLIGHYEVDLWGGIGVVRDDDERKNGRTLHEDGGFGHYLGEGFRRSEQHSSFTKKVSKPSCFNEPEAKRPRKSEHCNGTAVDKQFEEFADNLDDKRSLEASPETSKNYSSNHGSQEKNYTRSKSVEKLSDSDGETKVESKEEKLAAFRQLRSKILESGDKRLRLGPEEIMYLAETKRITSFHNGKELTLSDLWIYLAKQHGKTRMTRKFAVYRHLRKMGWIPHSGLSYGMDFLIYKYGAEHYHASAGVKILGSAESLEISALNRELFNVRKALIIAKTTIPHGVNCLNFLEINNILIELQTQSTFLPNRNFE